MTITNLLLSSDKILLTLIPSIFLNILELIICSILSHSSRRYELDCSLLAPSLALHRAARITRQGDYQGPILLLPKGYISPLHEGSQKNRNGPVQPQLVRGVIQDLNEIASKRSNEVHFCDSEEKQCSGGPVLPASAQKPEATRDT